MNALIDDLKREKVLGEGKAKQLRAWADIRNDAAHGRFEKFQTEITRKDVRLMIEGVGAFLDDYLR